MSEISLNAVKLNSLKFNTYKRTQLINLDWSLPNWDLKLLDIEENVKFDAIVTNPPYIPSNEINFLQNEVKYFDPLIALDGGKDGLDAYELIFAKLSKLLKLNGKIFVEIGHDQKEAVCKIALDNTLFPVDFGQDLSGITRVIVFTIK